MLKRIKIVLLSVAMIASLCAPCSAAESGIRDLFDNAFYGGLVGALVGGACLAFTNKPADHLNYISVGAASGILAGVGYSVAKGSRSMVSIEDGNVKVAMPTITPELQTVGPKGERALMMKAELLSARF